MLYDQVGKGSITVWRFTHWEIHRMRRMSSAKPSWKPIKGLRNLRDDSKFKAWIMRILSIRCKRKISGYITAKQQISLDDFIETPDDVSEETADCSDRVTLSQALSELAPDERAVVVLSAVQGYTTREIGEILDLPHGTVSSKLYRTLIKLRKKLEQQ